MKLMDIAKKMQDCSNADIVIYHKMEQIKKPQKAKDLSRKIEEEIIENFTVLSFSIIDNIMRINVK